jgi:hypothetical protein
MTRLHRFSTVWIFFSLQPSEHGEISRKKERAVCLITEGDIRPQLGHVLPGSNGIAISLEGVVLALA